jgi:hypothetical protein
MINSIKNILRGCPLTYKLGTKYRSWEQSRKIEKEQAYYEQKANELGVSRDFSIEKVKNQLKEKLSKRNIFPQKKPKENLHIVYASRPVPWDTQNIVPALKKFSRVTTYFYSDYGFNDSSKERSENRYEMNKHFINFLRNTNSEYPIDLILTYYSGAQIDRETIECINNMEIITCSFHLDDRLSFKGKFKKGHWSGPVNVCKSYDLNLTQAPESLVKYRVEGAIVMLWPLAANHEFFYPRGNSFKYDVSFVGSAHGNRKPFIDYLLKGGIKVETFGKGWLNGFVPNEKVPEIFSSSRIILNFGDIAYTDYQCGKCRDFEIPMSGGLMLTSHNEHLSKYFKLDEEVFTFRNREECLNQIHRLLADETLCERARKTSRERALREHTWEHRIQLLLQTLGYHQ